MNKKLLLPLVVTGLLLFAVTTSSSQNVGINTTGATPNSAAILDLSTGVTNMGFLAPQVALTSITTWSPVTGAATNGMLVYNTAAGVGSGVGYYYWANAQWNYLVNISNDWHITGNSGTTAGTNFLGTTDAKDLVFKTNGSENMRIANSTGFVGIGTTTPTLPLSVVTSANTAPLYLKSQTAYDLFSILPWNGVTYICDNAYYYNSTWYQGGSNAYNALIALDPAAGVLWYNSNNSAPSWNVASGATEWDVNGYWKNLVQSTAAGNSYFTGGNLGVATNNPTYAKFQVNGMVGNTVAYLSGSPNSEGISMVSDWPGIYFNCYYNGGTKAMSASGYPSMINTDQGVGGLYFLTTSTANTVADAAVGPVERMRITGSGNVGIGTSGPAAKLEIDGSSGSTLKIVDGNQGSGKILVSDATGQASWQSPGSILVYGNNAHSVTLTTLQGSTNTAAYTAIPGMTTTFTTLHTVVYVFASLTARLDQGSGNAAQFGQALENMALYVDGSPVAYTSAVITDYDSHNGIVTSGTCTFAGYPVTLAPGSHTFALYWEPTVLWASWPWSVMCNPGVAGAADECILTVFD